MEESRNRNGKFRTNMSLKRRGWEERETEGPSSLLLRRPRATLRDWCLPLRRVGLSGISCRPGFDELTKWRSSIGRSRQAKLRMAQRSKQRPSNAPSFSKVALRVGSMGNPLNCQKDSISSYLQIKGCASTPPDAPAGRWRLTGSMSSRRTWARCQPPRRQRFSSRVSAATRRSGRCCAASSSGRCPRPTLPARACPRTGP